MSSAEQFIAIEMLLARMVAFIEGSALLTPPKALTRKTTPTMVPTTANDSAAIGAHAAQRQNRVPCRAATARPHRKSPTETAACSKPPTAIASTMPPSMRRAYPILSAESPAAPHRRVPRNHPPIHKRVDHPILVARRIHDALPRR